MTISSKNKMLAVPFGVLEALNKVAVRMGTVHMTYGALRAIITHIDNSKDLLAFQYIETKTLWNVEKCKGFLELCIKEASPFLLERKKSMVRALQVEQLEKNIKFLEKTYVLEKELTLKPFDNDDFEYYTSEGTLRLNEIDRKIREERQKILML